MSSVLTSQTFKESHEFLLLASGLPSQLHSKLFEKLSNSVFDAGLYFSFEENVHGRQLVASTPLKYHSDVFLIDHAWSFRLRDARQQLEKNDVLLKRLAKLMCISQECGDTVSSENVLEMLPNDLDLCELTSLDLDEKNLTDNFLKELQLAEKFKNLETLSLWGNKLTCLTSLIESLRPLKGLKALWLNENPILHLVEAEALQSTILETFPNLEIFNSKFTERYGNWALSFCSEFPLLEAVELDLSGRGISSLNPQVFTVENLPKLTTLNLRGNPLRKMEGHPSQWLSTLKGLNSLKNLEVDISPKLSPTLIFEIVTNLETLNGLSLLSWQELANGSPPFHPPEENSLEKKRSPPSVPPKSSLLEEVLKHMWRYIQVYRLASEEKFDETPIWYIMDEVGSSLEHSKSPSMAVVPFLFMPDGTLDSGMSFSLMWPLRDICEGEVMSRDFLANIGEEKQRLERLSVWFQVPNYFFEQAYFSLWENRRRQLAEKKEVLEGSAALLFSKDRNEPIRVFSDLPYVRDHLKDPRFSIVEEAREAEICYMGAQIDPSLRKSEGIKESCVVNQFPFEASLVMKHHLPQTVLQAFGAVPWLPVTYNLEEDLAALIGEFRMREKLGENNLWIVKPWNMARSLDSWVLDSPEQMARMVESGPKICQKYIHQPALFQGFKFDLRFLVLLRSLIPLDLSVHHVFWIRVANNKYSTEGSSLVDFETHFTVMNYIGKLRTIPTHEFVEAFEKEHSVAWENIQADIYYVIKKVFSAAAISHPEMQSPLSRALYGVDIMLEESMQPKLLEITYCPDITRAINNDYGVESGPSKGDVFEGKDFVDSVFGSLFFNETNGVQQL